MPPDKLKLGLRAHDFHESLKLTGAFGAKDVHFKNTLLIGKAAALAMHLRGLLYADDLQQLEYAASSLGISSLELPAVLAELEEVDFAKVIRTGGKFKRLEIKIPEFRSGYEELGERWLILQPGEIEQAAVSALEDLHAGPIGEQRLIQSANLQSSQFAMLKDVMQAGQLMVVQPVDGEPIAFTPLAVDANPIAYLQWAKKFPKDIQALLDTLLANQGIPLTDTKIARSAVLHDAVQTGVLMPVQVTGATGDQRFVFAPKGGLRPEERTILDKARAILACVRYGQRFAQGRPIKYPRKILETLRDRKRFKQGHPDLFSQYGLLAEKLVGHPYKEANGNWNFRIDDTPENMKALSIAIEMLTIGDSPSAHIDLDAQRALLTPTGYLGPLTTRPQLVTHALPSAETRAEIIKQMARLARGMSTND